MSAFRTEVIVPQSRLEIEHQHTLLLVGSCFTQHIGQKLRELKFRTGINPFGITYNPISLAKAIEAQPPFTPDAFFKEQGLWRHWDLHSELASPDLAVAVQNANEASRVQQQYLQQLEVLLVTLGTSEVFFWNSQRPVSNCHKVPQSNFTQRRLSVEETVSVLHQAFESLRAQRPRLQVILTVSPIRHLRNGAVDNQRSKAILLLACEQLAHTLPYVTYFPAYELLMDDLRDYRFYASDMLHPSEVATAYIWEKFAQTYFSEKTRQTCRQIEKIVAAAAHRPFNPDTPEHRSFQEKQLAAIATLENRWPLLDFAAEKQVLENKL